jgi:hypothetical protein
MVRINPDFPLVDDRKLLGHPKIRCLAAMARGLAYLACGPAASARTLSPSIHP